MALNGVRRHAGLGRLHLGKLSDIQGETSNLAYGLRFRGENLGVYFSISGF